MIDFSGPIPWGALDMPHSKLYFDYASPDFDYTAVLQQVATHGAAVLTNTAAEAYTLKQVVAELGRARNTNWGFYFSVNLFLLREMFRDVFAQTPPLQLPVAEPLDTHTS